VAVQQRFFGTFNVKTGFLEFPNFPLHCPASYIFLERCVEKLVKLYSVLAADLLGEKPTARFQ
jgi:hypothetical protein